METHAFGWEDLGIPQDLSSGLEERSITPGKVALLVSVYLARENRMWEGTMAAAFKRGLLSLQDLEFLLQQRDVLDLGVIEVPRGGVQGRLMEEVFRAEKVCLGCLVGGHHYKVSFDWRQEGDVVTIDRRKDGAQWTHPGGYSDQFSGAEEMPFSVREGLRDIIDQFAGPGEDPPDLCQWRARKAWEEIRSGKVAWWGEQLSLDL